MTTDKQFITPADVVRLLQVSPVTAQAWCRRGRLGVKIGGRWRIDPDEVSNVIRRGGTSRTPVTSGEHQDAK